MEKRKGENGKRHAGLGANSAFQFRLFPFLFSNFRFSMFDFHFLILFVWEET